VDGRAEPGHGGEKRVFHPELRPHFFSLDTPARKRGVQGSSESAIVALCGPAFTFWQSRRTGTLYIGVTSDLGRRASEHRTDIVDGFTKRYGVHSLVYVEFHATMADAILRKKYQEMARGLEDRC
jgi:hypothetical protein